MSSKYAPCLLFSVSTMILSIPAAGQDSSGNAAAEALKKRLGSVVLPLDRVPTALVRVKKPKVCAIPLLNAPTNSEATIRIAKPRVRTQEQAVSVPAPSCGDTAGLSPGR